MLEEVKRWIARCASFLRLGEYEIEVALDPNLEPLGSTVCDPTYQMASVILRDPATGAHSDWRRTALHELIHVRMGGSLGTDEGTEERSALERGVEMMTRILYNLIERGADDATLARVARGCARTIETARAAERNGVMGNGARIAEIAMALGGMELPDEAKALVQELIGLASGDGGEPEPMSAEPMDGTDPLAACTPDEQKAYMALPAAARKAIGESTRNALRDTEAAERAALLKRIDVEYPGIKPVRREALRVMRPGLARIAVQWYGHGQADAPKGSGKDTKVEISPAARKEPETPKSGGHVPEIILFSGETTITPEVNALRHQMLRRFNGNVNALEWAVKRGA